MKKLVLNPGARNHFKVLLLNVDEIPESEKEQIELAEKYYNDLVDDENKEQLYKFSSIKSGYMVSVWKSKDMGYLLTSIENEFETYNNTLYVGKDINDLINIAKFLRVNLKTIMSDYKKQILDAKDMMRPLPEINETGESNIPEIKEC